MQFADYKALAITEGEVDTISINGTQVWESGYDDAVQGVPPLTLPNSKGQALKDYKIYGKSVQDGTPTPSNPIEVQSVGERTKNLYNSAAKLITSDMLGKTYTVSGNRSLSTVIINKIAAYAGATSRYQWVWSKNSTNNSYTFTVTDDMTGMYIYAISGTTYAQETAQQLKLDNYMIEESSAATAYEPYGYKIPVTATKDGNAITTNIYLDEPLRGIGDAWDYIDFANQKVVRNVLIYTFKGNEQVTVAHQVYIGSLSCDGFITIPNIKSQDCKYSVALCNILNLQHAAIWVLNDSINTFTINNIQFHIRIANELIGVTDYTQETLNTIKAKIKAWLLSLYNNGTPLIAYLPVATPTEESITLPSVLTQKGTNILGIGTTVQPNQVNAVYRRTVGADVENASV